MKQVGPMRIVKRTGRRLCCFSLRESQSVFRKAAPFFYLLLYTAKPTDSFLCWLRNFHVKISMARRQEVWLSWFLSRWTHRFFSASCIHRPPSRNVCAVRIAVYLLQVFQPMTYLDG